MTVPTTAFYGLVWLVLIAVVLMIFFANRLANTTDALDQQKRINAHNEKYYATMLAIFVSGILDRAQLTDPLPPLNSKKWSALIDLYNEPDLMVYNIPAQLTDGLPGASPTLYWKRGSVNEFDAHELARLWLAGVL